MTHSNDTDTADSFNWPHDSIVQQEVSHNFPIILMQKIKIL